MHTLVTEIIMPVCAADSWDRLKAFMSFHDSSNEMTDDAWASVKGFLETEDAETDQFRSLVAQYFFVGSLYENYMTKLAEIYYMQYHGIPGWETLL